MINQLDNNYTLGYTKDEIDEDPELAEAIRASLGAEALVLEASEVI